MKDYKINVAGKVLSAQLGNNGEVLLDGKSLPLLFHTLPNGCLSVESDGKPFEVFLSHVSENEVEVWINHAIVSVTLEDSRSQLLQRFASPSGQDHQRAIVKAPMPGLVTTVEVKTGDQVKAGQGLVILEAMKMENEIRSPIAGIVSSISVELRSPVEKGQQLMIIDPPPTQSIKG